MLFPERRQSVSGPLRVILFKEIFKLKKEITLGYSILDSVLGKAAAGCCAQRDDSAGTVAPGYTHSAAQSTPGQARGARARFRPGSAHAASGNRPLPMAQRSSHPVCRLPFAPKPRERDAHAGGQVQAPAA